MELREFLDHVQRGEVVAAGSEQHSFMLRTAQEAWRITADVNLGYRAPEEVRGLLSQLTGQSLHESVVVFPPFYPQAEQLAAPDQREANPG